MERLASLFLFAALCFSTVLAQNTHKLQLPEVSLSEDGVMLRHWLMIGPFDAACGLNAMNVDLIHKQHQNFSECNLSQTIGELMAQEGSGMNADGKMRVCDFNDVYRAQRPMGRGAGTAEYAACGITSAADSNVYLMLGSDGETKVWLNDSQVFHANKEQDAFTYEDAIRLHLQQGSNFLLVKVIHVGKNFGFAARLEPDAESAARTAIGINGGFLKHAALVADQRLELFARGLPDRFTTSATITDAAGVELQPVRLEADMGVDISSLKRGLYDARIQLKGQSFEQWFCVGSLEELYQVMLAQSRQASTGDRVAVNLGVLLRRIEYAIRPNFDSNMSEWDRQQITGDLEYNALYAASELHTALQRLGRGEEAFRDVPGLHLRGFRSQIDGQVMCYRLFVPSGYSRDGPGLPLVVVMHPVFSVPRPYLEGVEVGQQKEAEQWAHAAEALGVGILWEGYRICPYGNPIEFAHLDEVLATVAQDYRIDPTRITLYGTCSGGLTAAMEAVRNPRRYAAIAFYNPVLRRRRNRFDDGYEYATQSAYRAWLKETDPFLSLATMRGMPIWIMHDDDDPTHGPLRQSMEFIGAAFAAGNNPRFDRPKSTPTTWFQTTNKQLLVWLSQQRRNEPSPFEPTPHNEDGPLSRVFAERFIVVEATGGSQIDQEANARLSKEFQEAWRRTNYVGSSRRVTDTDLTPEEERQSNLVLLGNTQTNRVWARLSPYLPLKMEAGSIQIGGQTWTGQALSVQAWFSHPQNPARKVVVLGGYVPSETEFGTLELWLDGWFDFAIWQGGSHGPLLKTAQRYHRRSDLRR